ncbi:uncharacterized protein LOC130137556 [Syzygium oleosum]|uniref:uncharacterized protein LOC130137556 n=1 Tax=Syzygium oleosum TaxID=219896 RepID=UPI0024BB9CFE|nr:uncharacterized protein LOC130137556 [Syzygium oleosum]
MRHYEKAFQSSLLLPLIICSELLVSGKIQVICLDISSDKRLDKEEQTYTNEQFENVGSLRFLTVRNASIIGDSPKLLPELNWLEWKGCPTSFVATYFAFRDSTCAGVEIEPNQRSWEAWSSIMLSNVWRFSSLRIVSDQSGFTILSATLRASFPCT